MYDRSYTFEYWRSPFDEGVSWKHGKHGICPGFIYSVGLSILYIGGPIYLDNNRVNIQVKCQNNIITHKAKQTFWTYKKILLLTCHNR